jgi:O-antigen/teichoic acid export membrane protein
MSDLKNRAARGVKWTAVNSIANIILSPIVLTIMARILTPFEFGKIAIVTIVIGFSKKIASMGFAHAIIQADSIDDGDLSSVFWFEQFLGIFVFIVVWVLSPIIAGLFNTPEAMILIRYSSLVFLLEPIDLVFRALLKKELEYRFFIKASLVRLIFTQVSKISFVLLGFGAMSIVLANLIGITVLTLIMFTYFIYNDLWLPKFYFSFRQLKPYLRFGIFVFGKSILENLFKYIDEILIGGFFGTEILGMYHFAKNLVTYLTKIFNQPISEIGLPLLSKFKNDLNKLNHTYKKVVKYISTLSIPGHLGVLALSSVFIPLFFGQKWIEAIPLVMILSIWGLFKSLYTTVDSSILYSIGKSDIIFYINLLDVIIRSILIILIRPLGIEYIAILLVFISLTKFIFLQFIIKKYTNLKIYNFFKEFKNIILASIIMFISIFLIKLYILFNITFLNLFINIVIGSLFYFSILYLLEKEYLSELKTLVKSSI